MEKLILTIRSSKEHKLIIQWMLLFHYHLSPHPITIKTIIQPNENQTIQTK